VIGFQQRWRASLCFQRRHPAALGQKCLLE